MPRVKGTPHKDHLGNTYPSKNALVRAYNISTTIYDYRINHLKWSLEKTLTTPPQDTLRTTAIKCRDHLGNEFESKKAMCEYWHIPRAIYFQRIKAGWDLEKALTTKLETTMKTKKSIFDGQGNEFYNLDTMCEYYNISKTQYMINIRNNLSVQDALTSKTEPLKHPKDHLDNEYESINAMCRHYNITKTTLRSRLELGWTLQQILENPGNNSRYIKSIDHNGREFSTQKEMLDFYKVPYSLYKHREKIGYPLELQLSSENTHKVPCKDHHEQSFNCLQDMFEWWNVKPGSYHHHKNNNKSIADRILGTTIREKQIDENLRVNKKYGFYYSVTYKQRKYIWSDFTLHHYIRKTKVEKYLDENNNTLPQKYKIKKRYDNYYKVEINNSDIMLSSDDVFKFIFFSEYKPRANSATSETNMS